MFSFFRKYDRLLAVSFILLTAGFIMLMALNVNFFDWAFSRHHNQLSWYVRPLFLVPFCYFAFKKSWSGIGATIFLLLTSMFWFPVPLTSNATVIRFLDMEKEWLSRDWDTAKIAMTALIPFSLAILGIAFWKRNVWIGLTILVLIAVGKMFWSTTYGGDSGRSIFLPAIVGLLFCVAVIGWVLRKSSTLHNRK